jgi:hypothetical protein
VQANPSVTIEFYNGLWGHRDTIAVGEYYGTMYGVPIETYRPVHDAVAPLFVDASPQRVGEICRCYRIDAVIVADTDPVWQKRDSWVWQVKPLYANDQFRVLPGPAVSMASW